MTIYNSAQLWACLTTTTIIRFVAERSQRIVHHGKFILELARAREGEKTSWISVPRKTFWPPTVSSTNASFHKHESSTSLSFSDDNSSVQSSPWQRDHCWKQTNPRSNICKEMSLYYYRPPNVRFKLSRETVKRLRLKRRRPYDTTIASVSPLHYEIISPRELSIETVEDTREHDAMDLKMNGKAAEVETSNAEDSNRDENVPNGSHVNGTKDFTIKRRRGQLKRRKELISIVQQLTVRMVNSVNSTPRVQLSGIRSAFSNSSVQQHVSPRKRILRELEKVSLEDSSSTMKRSRGKPGSNNTVVTATTATPLASVNSNGNMTSGINNSNSSNSNNGKLINGSSTTEPHSSAVPTTPVSRPISSYSITSLLGHNSSNDSSSKSKQQETNSTTSHHPYHHQLPSHYHQYLGKDVITSPKSPSDAHYRYYGKKKSPSYGPNAGTAASPNSASEYNTTGGYGVSRSPDLSPSPEHQNHSFTRYRQHPYSIHPIVSSPSSYSNASRCSPSPNTNDSASSPYSNNAKYRSTYLTSSVSPPSSANPASTGSPQHYTRQSPLNFARSPPPSHQSSYPHSSSYRNNGKDPTLSPRASPSVEPIRVPATTPTSSNLSTPSIRTVPKKTAALRQQFGSPSSSPSIPTDSAKRERSNSNASSESSRTAHFKKELDYSERSASTASSVDVVDGLPCSSISQSSSVIRPSTVIASPTPHHPVPNPFYMYPPQIAASLLAAQQQSGAVPFMPTSPLTYYQHMYNQAAVAAAYRSPLWMHYSGLSPHAAAVAAAAAAAAVSPSVPPTSLGMSSAAPVESNHRDVHHPGAITVPAGSTTSAITVVSSASPVPASSALNYSAAALSATSHHQLGHHPGSLWGVVSPSSSHESKARQSAVSGGSATGTERDDPTIDVPLNLSKH
ncbi:protein hairless [Uranotaenia lowii]|uniref:protein hairless n=1 Tax=Uranotaenia lowii TaxID=190385 RepID=UPI002478675D|nr:protein hairless [Uranotaenia lowii]